MAFSETDAGGDQTTWDGLMLLTHALFSKLFPIAKYVKLAAYSKISTLFLQRN